MTRPNTELTDLRSASFLADEEDGENPAAVQADARGRLAAAAGLAATAPATLAGRLREPQDIVFGQPCKPFQVPILMEAAATIESLEAGGEAARDLPSLVGRLIGCYSVGPILANGTPEFGFRLYPTDDLRLEAAERLCALAPEVGALLGVVQPDAGLARR